MEAQIYVRRKADPSNQEGPFSTEQFLERLNRREVQFGDYAWKSGDANWMLVGSLALALKARGQDPAGDKPPELIFDRRLPQSEAAQKDFFLRLDAIRVSPNVPADCSEVILPLNVVLSPSPHQPGGKLLRRLVGEWTQLFAARIRFEQAGLIRRHPVRALLGERAFDGDLMEDDIALLASEELKRRALMAGADLLVQFSVRFELISDASQPGRGAIPVVIASALAALTAGAAEARRLKTRLVREDGKDEAAPAGSDSTAFKVREAELAERERQIEEREAFLMDAEARLMEKIEEQQVREVELDHKEDQLRSSSPPG